MELTSDAFAQGARIPAKYTCDGDNASPPLAFSGIPEATKSLALIMDDPDVPRALRPEGVFDHWVLYNIPADRAGLGEKESAGLAGLNGRGAPGYTGPCPPPDYEPAEHRYFFRLYALDAFLPFREGARKNEVLAAMEGHILATAELMGRYARG